MIQYLVAAMIRKPVRLPAIRVAPAIVLRCQPNRIRRDYLYFGFGIPKLPDLMPALTKRKRNGRTLVFCLTRGQVHCHLLWQLRACRYLLRNHVCEYTAGKD